MSITIMLLVINGLAGFALGLMGRTRLAILTLPFLIVFSAATLWAVAETGGQIFLKMVLCMFAAQGAFLLVSIAIFFMNLSARPSVLTVSKDGASKPHIWAKKSER
jgi:hypothetical protein